MKPFESFAGLSALYLLRADGRLGVLTGEGQFEEDRELSEAFRAHNAALLAQYAKQPGPPLRLGIVYRAAERRVWGHEVLLLEQEVVRELYRVSGPAGRELTAFQKKNREKSLYRGGELLIDFRPDAATTVPIYCPVLYARGLSLGRLAPALDMAPGLDDARGPALEVLNLLAPLPISRRDAPAIAKLVARVRDRLVRKEMRRASGLALLDRVSHGAESAEAGEFFDVDRRHERAVSLPSGLAPRHGGAEERVADVERWLERPHRPVDAALLRRFQQFRDLDDRRLALLADRSLVHTAPAGTRLLNHGMTDAWNLYLLEGTLSLEAADGQALLVEAGSERAASPVAFLKPRKYSVTSLSPVSFLWIPDRLLAEVLAPASAPTPSAPKGGGRAR